jgi:hypothetical protein
LKVNEKIDAISMSSMRAISVTVVAMPEFILKKTGSRSRRLNFADEGGRRSRR